MHTQYSLQPIIRSILHSVWFKGLAGLLTLLLLPVMPAYANDFEVVGLSRDDIAATLPSAMQSPVNAESLAQEFVSVDTTEAIRISEAVGSVSTGAVGEEHKYRFVSRLSSGDAVIQDVFIAEDNSSGDASTSYIAHRVDPRTGVLLSEAPVYKYHSATGSHGDIEEILWFEGEEVFSGSRSTSAATCNSTENGVCSTAGFGAGLTFSSTCGAAGLALGIVPVLGWAAGGAAILACGIGGAASSHVADDWCREIVCDKSSPSLAQITHFVSVLLGIWHDYQVTIVQNSLGAKNMLQYDVEYSVQCMKKWAVQNPVAAAFCPAFLIWTVYELAVSDDLTRYYEDPSGDIYLSTPIGNVDAGVRIDTKNGLTYHIDIDEESLNLQKRTSARLVIYSDPIPCGDSLSGRTSEFRVQLKGTYDPNSKRLRFSLKSGKVSVSGCMS